MEDIQIELMQELIKNKISFSCEGTDEDLNIKMQGGVLIIASHNGLWATIVSKIFTSTGCPLITPTQAKRLDNVLKTIKLPIVVDTDLFLNTKKGKS